MDKITKITNWVSLLGGVLSALTTLYNFIFPLKSMIDIATSNFILLVCLGLGFLAYRYERHKEMKALVDETNALKQALADETNALKQALTEQNQSVEDQFRYLYEEYLDLYLGGVSLQEDERIIVKDTFLTDKKYGLKGFQTVNVYNLMHRMGEEIEHQLKLLYGDKAPSDLNISNISALRGNGKIMPKNYNPRSFM